MAAGRGAVGRVRYERMFYYILIGIHLVLAPLALPSKIYLQAQILGMMQIPVEDES